MNSDAAAAAVAALEAEEAEEAKDASEEANDNNHSSPITVTVTSGSTQYIAMAGKNFTFYIFSCLRISLFKKKKTNVDYLVVYLELF